MNEFKVYRAGSFTGLSSIPRKSDIPVELQEARNRSNRHIRWFIAAETVCAMAISMLAMGFPF